MSYVCAVFGISYVVGLLLTLAVEIPIATLCKIVLARGDSTENVNEIPMERRSKSP
jgi:hypothetical protein